MIDFTKDRILIDAIDIFIKKTKSWELSKDEKDLLEKSKEGNYGAFCDLLASQGLQNNEEFNEFFDFVNSMPDDVN